ncbi:MAG: dUTP diphosphatase [Actinomycetes bacterium]
MTSELPQRGAVDVLILRLDPDLPVPTYAHPGDAGLDLLSTVDAEVAPFQRLLLPTGIALALPDGYAGFIHPRSGLAIREGLTVANAPGTVDAGSRGEIKVAVVNLNPSRAVDIRRGDRIAQLVVQRVERAVFHEVERLPGSARASGGFGSTGRSADTGQDQSQSVPGGSPDVAIS